MNLWWNAYSLQNGALEGPVKGQSLVNYSVDQKENYDTQGSITIEFSIAWFKKKKKKIWHSLHGKRKQLQFLCISCYPKNSAKIFYEAQFMLPRNWRVLWAVFNESVQHLSPREYFRQNMIQNISHIAWCVTVVSVIKKGYRSVQLGSVNDCESISPGGQERQQQDNPQKEMVLQVVAIGHFSLLILPDWFFSSIAFC